MNTPILPVDFNEMIAPDLVLLSKDDYKRSIDDEMVTLVEGLEIVIMANDFNDNGNPDNLVANGVVELNSTEIGWAKSAKWCCRIDHNGIRHQSDL